MRSWLALSLTLICTAVFGHGSEQWISDAKLVDPVSKAICCGPTDCSVLAPGSVERVQGGYKVNTGWWTGYDPFFVAWDRALPFSTGWALPHLYQLRRRKCDTESQVLHHAAECCLIAKEFPQQLRHVGRDAPRRRPWWARIGPRSPFSLHMALSTIYQRCLTALSSMALTSC
jgi:hypothetical protein